MMTSNGTLLVVWAKYGIILVYSYTHIVIPGTLFAITAPKVTRAHICMYTHPHQFRVIKTARGKEHGHIYMCACLTPSDLDQDKSLFLDDS